MRRIATTEEFFEAYGRLGEQDRRGLRLAADHHARRCPGFGDGGDLLGELIVRVAGGSRQWAMETPLMAFLCLGLRSLADGDRHLARNAWPHVSLDAGEGGPDYPLLAQAGPSPSAEDVACAAQLAEGARAACESARRSLGRDWLAVRALEGMQSEMSIAEMAAAFGAPMAAMKAARARASARLRTWAASAAEEERRAAGRRGGRR